MAVRVEPLDGEFLKVKYPNGDLIKRKFIVADPIQVLFDFIGQDEMASEVFRIQEATSSNAIESTSTGSISDHGIKPFSTLYILWTSPLDNLEKHSDPVNVAQPPMDSSFVQSSVALSPVQSPVTPTSAQPAVVLPTAQSPAALPYVQPSVASFTAQTPFINFNFEDQPAEPIVIDIDEETPHSSPSPQPSDIVDLSLIGQGSSVVLDEVDLQTILKKLQSKIDGNICPTANQINVFRENILHCSLQAIKRRRFNPQAKLDVVFVDADENGEGAIDEGGPTREYLRLLMRSVHQSNVFQGNEKDRSLALDTQALETTLYASVGKMIALCVVHRGVGPHFFSERLFQQICGVPTSPASVDEIGDHTLREQLIKIQEATTVLEANCAITEAADSLSIIGALRYVSSLTERNSLVQSAAEFFVNGRLRAALDQFSEGLQTLGLLEEMQKYPAVFYDMFVNEQRPLQAKDLCSLFYVNFSPQGSNRRAKENQTVCHWRDWLIDVEEGESDAMTLERIMEFATGASTVPPLGFPHRPEIEFLHQDGKIFPEANTCLIILRLPIHKEYEMFKTYMTEGIMQSPYFGVA
ncbi:G2 M phase-specific E3 ubiquitin- ligase-like protein [Labeo rohita]|uniref:HECT-type E3 ubiquitin transferase n=1 Tax=Labeo rohita TaxID=84645 RepID=A0A498MZ99_LABRO|nr:G2 M phase-specific E3 ubiquitin- ligase-like protein [Labeo rohita]